MLVVHAVGVTFATMQGQKASKNSGHAEDRMPQTLPFTDQEVRLSERDVNSQVPSSTSASTGSSLKTHGSRAWTQFSYLLFHLLALGLSVSSVELMIIRNDLGSLRATDNQWNFGQIHALLVLYGPFITLLRTVRIFFKKYKAKASGSSPENAEVEGDDEDDTNLNISRVFRFHVVGLSYLWDLDSYKFSFATFSHSDSTDRIEDVYHPAHIEHASNRPG